VFVVGKKLQASLIIADESGIHLIQFGWSCVKKIPTDKRSSLFRPAVGDKGEDGLNRRPQGDVLDPDEQLVQHLHRVAEGELHEVP
jgi:hypothetical protein